jgi:hypothetical protein
VFAGSITRPGTALSVATNRPPRPPQPVDTNTAAPPTTTITLQTRPSPSAAAPAPSPPSWMPSALWNGRPVEPEPLKSRSRPSAASTPTRIPTHMPTPTLVEIPSDHIAFLSVYQPAAVLTQYSTCPPPAASAVAVDTSPPPLRLHSRRPLSASLAAAAAGTVPPSLGSPHEYERHAAADVADRHRRRPASATARITSTPAVDGCVHNDGQSSIFYVPVQPL